MTSVGGILKGLFKRSRHGPRRTQNQLIFLHPYILLLFESLSSCEPQHVSVWVSLLSVPVRIRRLVVRLEF